MPCLQVLDAAEADNALPVYRGCSAPLIEQPRPCPQIHGKDSLGDLDPPLRNSARSCPFFFLRLPQSGTGWQFAASACVLYQRADCVRFLLSDHVGLCPPPAASLDSLVRYANGAYKMWSLLSSVKLRLFQSLDLIQSLGLPIQLKETAGTTTVIALGPLTNIALAFRLEPEVMRTKVSRIVWMGTQSSRKKTLEGR